MDGEVERARRSDRDRERREQIPERAHVDRRTRTIRDERDLGSGGRVNALDEERRRREGPFALTREWIVLRSQGAAATFSRTA
jgi:hypothetical protein